jgi:hypothetical protein
MEKVSPMRSSFKLVLSSILTLVICDLASAQTQTETTIEKSSVCLPKYQLLAERNSEVPGQIALCSAVRTTHEFPTRKTPDQDYAFHKKIEDHHGELVVHVPFRLIQLGLSTAVDKEYFSTSGYSNNSKSDQTLRSDTAYIGIQWTANLNTTFSYLKERDRDSSYDQERVLSSLSYQPFGSFLGLNASVLVEDYRLLAKFAAFAEITDVHEVGLIIQPIFGLEATTQKELIHTFRADGHVLQTRFILQESKENPDYRSLETSDGIMLSHDQSYEVFENNIVGVGLFYANYKKFSSTDTIYPEDFESPPYEYPATERGYGWGLSLNYSYLF